MAFGRQIYNSLFRRTSTFALTIVVGAVLFERVFDQSFDNYYERVNQGLDSDHDTRNDILVSKYCFTPPCVNQKFTGPRWRDGVRVITEQVRDPGRNLFVDAPKKLWKHIKHNYEKEEESD